MSKTARSTSPFSGAHKALLLAAAVCALAGAVQAAPAATPAALTTGPAADVNSQAYSFVQTYAATTPKIQEYARWDLPICVQVTGLVPAKAAVVRGRVEEVAKALGVSAAKDGCAPNLEIVFSATPQKVIDEVAQRQEMLLGYEHRNSKALRTVTQPIQAWYATATVGGAGPNAGGTSAYARVLDDSNNDPPPGCGDSKFRKCLKSVFENVLVVVDTGRAKSTSVGLISDYVAMVALSQPRSLDRCNVLPSVTDLYVGACPGRGAPAELTPADAAYLTALYAADPEANGEGQTSDIAGRMAKILSSAQVVSR